MTTQTKIFDRSNLKNLSPELQDQIIARFNNYDLLLRVMKTVSNNLKTIAQTTTGMNYTDKQDIYEFARLLKDATDENWQAANHLYY